VEQVTLVSRVKLKDRGTLLKEPAFFGDEEIEARQVYLLIVRFYLREVGVER